MAIGTFNVDDDRVMAAVQMQLLLGEVRRVGDLIEQYASRHNDESTGPDDDVFGGAGGNLNQYLNSWLRGRHSCLSNMVKAKLRELEF